MATEFDDDVPTKLVPPLTMDQIARQYEAQWGTETLYPELELDCNDNTNCIGEDEPTVKMTGGA